nr:hypothetical protein OG461_34785 [Streptomyces sp. NBC_00995]
MLGQARAVAGGVGGGDPDDGLSGVRHLTGAALADRDAPRSWATAAAAFTAARAVARTDVFRPRPSSQRPPAG